MIVFELTAFTESAEIVASEALAARGHSGEDTRRAGRIVPAEKVPACTTNSEAGGDSAWTQTKRAKDVSVRNMYILASEETFENYCDLIGWLARAQSGFIRCLDAPLEYPVNFILDHGTCLCLMENKPKSNDSDDSEVRRREMKTFIRALTGISFKFATIWVVVLEGDRSQLMDASLFADLCQALSEFPTQVDIICFNTLRIYTIRVAVMHEGRRC